MDVFHFSSYRTLIESWIKAEVDAGGRTKLAQAAGCNPSWITRVLSGNAHFTPDQAYGITRFLDLNEGETDYFLLLVELERAATQALKSRIESKLKSLQVSGREIGSSVKTDSSISEEDRVQYYSSWIYGAVHAACMIQAFSQADLAARLRIEPEKIRPLLANLLKMGLVSNRSGRWQATSKSVHLPSGHPMANLGHTHWRHRTIQLLQEGGIEGLHYSGIHHLSLKDMEVVRRKLKEATLSCRDLIEKSPGETLGVLCLDWYGL